MVCFECPDALLKPVAAILSLSSLECPFPKIARYNLSLRKGSAARMARHPEPRCKGRARVDLGLVSNGT